MNRFFLIFTPGGMTIKLNFTGFIIYSLIGFDCTIFIFLDHNSFFFRELPMALPAYYNLS